MIINVLPPFYGSQCTMNKCVPGFQYYYQRGRGHGFQVFKIVR